ncbi:hypothetical protein ABT119_05715 [Streptomyces sp. NPDC001910]|uniref:hypothetical protein n=1 Tax=Streptomyces sp. NPDC001910 TaxID=3154403 RepID=UPI00332C7D8A
MIEGPGSPDRGCPGCDERSRTVAATRASEDLLQQQVDAQAQEIDRLRAEVDKLNSSEWKMDPWMQERFRKRAIQWGNACLIVEVAQDRKDPYLDIDEMAEALGLNEGEDDSQEAAMSTPEVGA